MYIYTYIYSVSAVPRPALFRRSEKRRSDFSQAEICIYIFAIFPTHISIYYNITIQSFSESFLFCKD